MHGWWLESSNTRAKAVESYPSRSGQTHSKWLGTGQNVKLSRSCTNGAKPCFLLKENPASLKMAMTSLSVVVQLVSCSRITSGSRSSASCCKIVILVAVRLSMISWRIVGFRNFLKGILCEEHSLSRPEKRRFPNSRSAFRIGVEGFLPFWPICFDLVPYREIRPQA